MKNLPKNLRPSFLAVLLVPSFACTKPNFVLLTDAGTSGGVGGTAEVGSGGAIGSGPDASMTCDAAGWSPICVPPDTLEICDPVCQTGGCNWCLEKCTYALVGGTAQPTCAAKDPSPAGVFQACGVNASGLGNQDDNCAPGSICLQPYNGGSPSVGYCFPMCHNLTDCAFGVACTERSLSAAGGTVNVCDPPYDVCGPDGTCCNPYAQPASSCGQGRVCLLVSPDPSRHSRTVCEFSSGDSKNGAACASAHDCLLGNTCVNNGCHRVCDPTTNLCPTGAACTARGSEYSFCPSD